MAISFIGSASAGAANGGAVTVTLPGGMQADDLIIVCFADGDTVDNSAAQAMTTSGYTNVSRLYGNGATNDMSLTVWYKYHVADTTAVSAAIGGTNAANADVVMVFRGVALAADGGPFSTASTTATGTTGGLPNPASIATVAGDLVTIAVGSASGTAGTYTFPTNYTVNAGQQTAADTVDAQAGMGFRTGAPGNPEDPGVFASTGTGLEGWGAVTMALKEAPVVAIAHHYRGGRGEQDRIFLGS